MSGACASGSSGARVIELAAADTKNSKHGGSLAKSSICRTVFGEELLLMGPIGAICGFEIGRAREVIEKVIYCELLINTIGHYINGGSSRQ